MTTYRCEPVDPDKLTFQFVDSNEPDLIGVEVMLDGNVLIDISMNTAGATSVLFDVDGAQWEMELGHLQTLLEKCKADLLQWRDALSKPGGIWDTVQ